MSCERRDEWVFRGRWAAIRRSKRALKVWRLLEACRTAFVEASLLVRSGAERRCCEGEQWAAAAETAASRVGWGSGWTRVLWRGAGVSVNRRGVRV